MIEHALRVNRCDKAAWQQHRREAKEVYDRRSTLSWTVDYGPFGVAANYGPEIEYEPGDDEPDEPQYDPR